MSDQRDPLEQFQEAYAEYILAYGRNEVVTVVDSYLDKVRRVVADLVAAKIVEELFKDDRPWYRLFEPKS